MKKALAVGLSLLLIVTAMIALSLSGSAAGTPTTQVTVGGTTLNASKTTMTAGSGTVTFDAASGTLTLNNATGVGGITGTNGNLTVIATGTNTMSVSSGFLVNHSTGHLTFGGTGFLTMTSGNMGVYVSGGDLTVTDSVTLDVSGRGVRYIFGTKGSNDIVFEEDCTVTLSGSGAGIIFQKTSDGTQKVTVKDNASVEVNTNSCNDSTANTDIRGAVSCMDLEILSGSLTVDTKNNLMPAVDCKGSLTVGGGTVTVKADTNSAVAVNCGAFSQSNGTLNVTATNAGADAFKCTGLSKTGGDMTVTVEGNNSLYKIQGIYVSGNNSTVATFSGGNLTVNMSSAYTSATDVHAIYLHHVAAANFSGTNVTLNVTTPKAGVWSSAILTGWTKAVNITGGKIVANLNSNTTGLICPRRASDDFVLTVSGGTLSGTAPSLLNTANSKDSTASDKTTSVAVNITDGARINLATAGGVFSSAKEYTVVTTGSTASFLTGYGFDSAKGLVTMNMADEIYSVNIYDTAGGKTVLNKANPSMTAGSGTIVYDPTAGTLTMTDATAQKVEVVMGDLKIIARGTNTLAGSVSFLVDSDVGDVIFGGDGTLNINATGMAVYASAGDLIAEDSITLNVSGSSLVYNVKNSDATDGNMIFRDNAKVTVNGTGYQALYQNQKSPYSTDQKLLIEDSAKVQVNIPNASSGSGTYTTAILIRGFKMTGGSLELNLTGAADASSRVLGIQVQCDNGAKGAVELLGGKLTVNHVSQKPGESLAYSIYTYKSSGITFGGTEVVLNLTSAKGGDTSGVICPAMTPFVKMTGGSISVNANDKTTALITPRLTTNTGFFFEMTGGTVTGKVPSFLNTNLDGVSTISVSIKEGATINLETPSGALSSHQEVTVNTSGTTATFLEGCGLITGNEYLATGNAFQPGDILTGVVITDAKGTTTLNYGYRTYNGSVGQIRLDPAAKTLTFDGVVGPTSVTVPASVEIMTVGTNRIEASSTALTVNGVLTLSGTGSLELAGSNGLISATDVTVQGGEVRFNATSGSALSLSGAFTVGQTAKVRMLSAQGIALAASSVTVKDGADLKVYSDDGMGIDVTTVSVLASGKLTVDAKDTGISVDNLTLSGEATGRIHSETLGIACNTGTITLRDTSKLNVLEDKADAKGIVLYGSAVTTSQAASIVVGVTGKGISLASTAPSSITVKDNSTVTVDGINAVDPAIAVTSAYIKAGEGSWNAYLQDEISGTENYVLLSAQNPGGDYALADYTAVNAAIAAANALDKNLYKDFSAVTAAINAVVPGKNITQQAAVDAMAKAINDAVAALEYKDADYTAVNKAITDANALNKDLYKDFSAVTAAINAVVSGKNITEQAEVDAMAKAINDAVAALEYKDADYTAVNKAITDANALNKDLYKDFSAVTAAVNAVVPGKNITEQAAVDAMAKAIDDAVAALEYKDADYTAVNKAIADANALNKDLYKDFSAVTAAINAVVTGKNITEQAAVDAMAKAINDAVAGLEMKETSTDTESSNTGNQTDTTDSGTGTDSATGTQSGNTGSAENPSTSDVTVAVSIIALLLAAGAALILLTKKRHG